MENPSNTNIAKDLFTISEFKKNCGRFQESFLSLNRKTQMVSEKGSFVNQSR